MDEPLTEPDLEEMDCWVRPTYLNILAAPGITTTLEGRHHLFDSLEAMSWQRSRDLY